MFGRNQISRFKLKRVQDVNCMLEEKKDPAKAGRDDLTTNDATNVMQILFYFVSQAKLASAPSIRVCIIGKEYYDWLNGAADTQDKRFEYASSLSNEAVTRILQNSSYANCYSLAALPLLVIPPKTDITRLSLDKDTRTELEKQIRWIFPDADAVYIPGCIMRPIDLSEAEPHLLSMARTWHEEGIRVRFGKWDEQEFDPDESSPVIFCVPFVLISKADTAAVNDIDDYIYQHPAMFPGPDSIDVDDDALIEHFTPLSVMMKKKNPDVITEPVPYLLTTETLGEQMEYLENAVWE